MKVMIGLILKIQRRENFKPEFIWQHLTLSFVGWNGKFQPKSNFI
jgi:hypothetical protein